MRFLPHQYIDRETGQVRNERLFGDRMIHFLYSRSREEASVLFNALASSRISRLLAFASFDLPFMRCLSGLNHFLRKTGIDLSECVESPESFRTPRHVFERKIRYWETRPMPDEPEEIVAPADSRMLLGSLFHVSQLFLKEKFFTFFELLGIDKKSWLQTFAQGDFAIFRLTPEKYHYNHVPVAGVVRDFYEIPGLYHSCNPGAVVHQATPYSKNSRVVTIIDTDVEGGTQAGFIAMIEIVALMIGEVCQCYSKERYEHPVGISPGMFLHKGQPKSLFRPGSSTVVVIFERGRIRFSGDLIANSSRQGLCSRFSQGFDKPLGETEVKVRSSIGRVNPMIARRRYSND